MIPSQATLPVEDRPLRLASSLDSAAFRGPEHPTDDAFQDAARHEQIAILATTFGFLALIAGSLTAFCYFVRSPWAPAGATIECKGWAHGRPVDLERKRFPDLRLWHGGRRDDTLPRVAPTPGTISIPLSSPQIFARHSRS